MERERKRRGIVDWEREKERKKEGWGVDVFKEDRERKLDGGMLRIEEI